jgi:hypothetical protein
LLSALTAPVVIAAPPQFSRQDGLITIEGLPWLVICAGSARCAAHPDRASISRPAHISAAVTPTTNIANFHKSRVILFPLIFDKNYAILCSSYLNNMIVLLQVAFA